MADVQCGRCGKRAAGLTAPPLPGAIGSEVLAAVCAECWRAWLGQQVKVINEYRVSPGDPTQYDFLVAQMREYLRLPGT